MSEYIFWLLTAAYAAHIMEEYTLNWKKWVYTMIRLEVEWGDFFVTNATVIVFGICAAMIGFKNPYISFIYPALMLINGIFFHILPTVIKKVLSPGAITSILLFIPLALLAYLEAYRHHLFNFNFFMISTLGGVFVMAYPILLLWLKKRISK